MSPLQLSFVIAAWNEADNLPTLLTELEKYFSLFSQMPEVIIVDDGSTDDSRKILDAMQAACPWLKPVYVTHQGKSHAWQTGFATSSREWICTMDADLQNDPADLALLLAEADKGFDFISGKRRRRVAGRFSHVIPSWMGNTFLRLWTGVNITDHGCGMKLFKRKLVQGLPLPEGAHRYLGILAHARGGRVTEVMISDRPRHSGLSRYTTKRCLVFAQSLLMLRRQLKNIKAGG